MSVDAGSSGTNPGQGAAKPAAATGWEEKEPQTIEACASFYARDITEVKTVQDTTPLEMARRLALAESEADKIHSLAHA